MVTGEQSVDLSCTVMIIMHSLFTSLRNTIVSSFSVRSNNTFLYFFDNTFSGENSEKDVNLSILSKYDCCMYSVFGCLGGGIGEGNEEEGTLKIDGGSFGRKVPPRIVTISVSLGQCWLHILK